MTNEDLMNFEFNSIDRLEVYRSRWGDPVDSSTVKIGGGRSIKIHSFLITLATKEINDGNNFYALITDGLSDTAVVADIPRTEFIWYVNKPEDVHYNWLSFISTIHIVDKVDLFHRTLPIVPPPCNQQPLSPKSLLSSATVITPVLRRDMVSFNVQGAETYTLLVLPITESERAYLQNRNDNFGKALADLLEPNQHPVVLNPLRKSYV